MHLRPLLVATVVFGAASVCAGVPGTSDVARDRLVAALLGPTPLASDFEALVDRIGGRPTGSPANEQAVTWALARFHDAGVAATREPFPVRPAWLERSATAVIRGEGVTFSPRVAAMPYSTGTAADGLTAPLLDAGRGSEEDFARLGDQARDAFVLVTQDELQDVDGLFREYDESAAVEARAIRAGVAGVAYMGSRASGVLYRHNVSSGPDNTRPMVVLEREAALRAARLLASGVALAMTLHLDVVRPDVEAANVVAEVPGTTHPDEIVLMGAHLDAWDLGGGALDNGINAAMLIDIARQITRLGLHPARTIRLVLWNGEELGMLGSFAYVKQHAIELDAHVVAGSVDIGCGRITGFFTGGRPALVTDVDRVLAPLRGLGPFTQVDAPIVGTDNLDFMLEGVPNVVANQAPALYGPSYHASNDQVEQCDVGTVRLNAAIVAGLIWGFAEAPDRLPRQTRGEVQALMDRTELDDQMKTFNLWADWASGRRGRRP